MRLAVTGGYDSQGSAPTDVKDRLLGARVEVEQRLAAALRFRGGADVRFDHYGIEITRQGAARARRSSER